MNFSRTTTIIKAPIILLVFIFYYTSALATNFINRNKLYSLAEISFTPYPTNPKGFYLKFGGDTIINNIEYTQLIKSYDKTMNNFSTISYWHETNGKVFKFDGSTTEELVYNFNVEVGDTFKVEPNSFLVLSKKEITNWGKINRKKYTFYPEGDTNSDPEIWIEGVGNIRDPRYSCSYLLTGGETDLICYYEYDTLIYKNPYFDTCFACFPNDTIYPLLSTDKVWSIAYNYQDSNNDFSLSKYLKVWKDSIIAGTKYKLVIQSDDEFHKIWDYSHFKKLEEDDGEVFYNNKLLYDFNIRIGDTIFYENNVFLVVDNIWSDLYFDIQNRWHYEISVFQNDQKIDNTVWVQGIGSINGLFSPFVGYNQNEEEKLLCVYHRNELVYASNESCGCYIQTGLNEYPFSKDLISIYSLGNKQIFIDYKTRRGSISFFTINGQLVKTIKVDKEIIVLPNTGIYLYVFKSEDGLIQQGKINCQ